MPIVQIIPIKNRSPRVVAKGKNPFRLIHGESASHTVRQAMAMNSIKKNVTLGQVQYIHWNSVFNHSNIS
jgi:hypothetical protein